MFISRNLIGLHVDKFYEQEAQNYFFRRPPIRQNTILMA